MKKIWILVTVLLAEVERVNRNKGLISSPFLSRASVSRRGS
jgi:hypothetical protein